MSDMFWEDDGGQTARPAESNGMRVLREKAEADSKRLNEMADQIATLTSSLNAERVEKVVTSKGYDPAVVAALTEAGLPADPQAVSAFLEKHGNLFAKASGVTDEQTGTGAATGESVVPGDEQAAMQAQAAAAAGAQSTTGMSALENQMRGATSVDELMKVIQSSGL
jgi:hypothetical protein